MPYRPWTEDEVKRARAMHELGYSYSEIDKVLRRSADATRQRLQSEEYPSGHAVRSRSISEVLLAEREARDAARDQRTLTQEFFGDPPPGYSALHGRTGQR